MKQLPWIFALIIAATVVRLAFSDEKSTSVDESAFRVDAKTEVILRSEDSDLQRLFDAAESRLAENIVQFTPQMKILVEGGGYPNAWIETQPMGGAMYAKRNNQVALNNQLIFMLAQREDGRLPGMVVSGETVRKKGWDRNPLEGYVWKPDIDVAADYEMFQGLCFPEPAWRMYHWMGKDKAYLQLLHDTLVAHDAYLWRTRDSNGDGLLETWCVWDTGEDDSNRLTRRWAPHRWPFEKPPGTKGLPTPENLEDLKRYWFSESQDTPTSDQVLVPFASMDVMAYSYSMRATLAKVSAELDNGQQEEWEQKADDVRARLIDGLWDAERNACYDRDRNGQRLPELVHNNLRCMWYGIFNQKMADAFIKHHLLNPDEFWTAIPLVSIARNESLYENAEGNNWSGQPQGLTYQRAIDALENYGHYAEVSLIGQKFLPTLIRNDCKFSQQLDSATGNPSGPRPDGYGPTALAALEYFSRMHGIHIDVENEHIWWSGLDNQGKDYTYSQTWGNHMLTLECRDGEVKGMVRGLKRFTVSTGTRVVTNFSGKPLAVIGIHPEEQEIILDDRNHFRKFSIKPNQQWIISGDKMELKRSAPFDYPFQSTTE